ncbi:MAG: signal transduction histidine kinase [Tardiphaga sp.]|nr:signal transduction histidine kinase [Tardiphaga sp.]
MEVPLSRPQSSDRLLRALLIFELPVGARYGLATFAVIIATLIRWALPVTGVPYLPFFPILMIVGFGLGLGPGLYATMLSALVATWLFAGVTIEVDPSSPWIGAVIYALVGAFVVAVCAALNAALRSRDVDISARIETERRLAQSEERLTVALGASGMVGVWDWDLRTDTVHSDANFARIYGVDPELASKGAPLAAFVSGLNPGDQPAFAAALSEALEGDGNFSSEYRLRQPDGTERWILARGRVIRDADGKPSRLPGAAIDVTDRKLAELRQSARVALNDRLRDLEDIAEMSFAAAEILGTTLNVSRAGYGTIDPRTETIHIDRDWNAAGIKSLAGVLHFRDYGSYIENLRRGETVAIANVYLDPRTAEGGDALKAISAQSFVNMPVTEHGGFVALLYLNHAEPRAWSRDELTLIRDVADRTRNAIERRRAEQELRALAGSLERQVEARTAELRESEATLRQSQKMEAVGQLTGGVAHDFNNLLQVVSGNLQLLGRDIAGNAKAQRRVDNASIAVDRGAKLASQLLAFGRRQALEPKVINVGRLVTGMDEMLRRSLGEAVEIETVVSGGLWNTLIDPAQVENALLNLAINARDAMRDTGKLTIEVGNAYLDDAYARKHDDVAPGQYVVLAVTDTGTGMSPEVMARVFEPFFSTKPEGHGTGLGLSMVYGFVKQSKGHIKIYSEVGQGTTIKLYLPRAEQREDIVAPADDTPIQGGTETVLIAEDDDGVRAVAVDLLTELGYRVLTAHDAASALTVVESGVPIDLLFTDVVMPGPLKSPELARKARELLPDLVVLFTSGYTENAIVHGGRLDAGVELLPKPYTREALALKVRRVLEKA